MKIKRANTQVRPYKGMIEGRTPTLINSSVIDAVSGQHQHTADG